MSIEDPYPAHGARHPGPASPLTAADLAGNRLLAGLPDAELEPIRESGERIRTRMREALLEQKGRIEHVYFPQSGVFSLLTQMADGSMIEALTIGNEGMVGLPAILGAARSPTRAICQISGWAVRVPTGVVRDMVPRTSVLFARMACYAQAQLTSLYWSAACNRLHSAQQRYARWVLITHDRAGTDEFSITQEFLAQMLGVTRPTVSLVGQELQRLRVIHTAHGRLTVDDRAGVERIACECYGEVRDSFDELLGVRRG